MHNKRRISPQKVGRKYKYTKNSANCDISSTCAMECEVSKPRKRKVAQQKVNIGGTKYQCYLTNEPQSNSSDESSDNERTVKHDTHIQNVDNAVETVRQNSCNAEISEEETDDNVLLSLKCQLCRMCGRKRTALTPIFGKHFVNGVSISKKIEMHLRLKVRADDGLPPNICLSCNSMLQAWHDLHVSCVAADAVLRRMFKVTSENMFDCSQGNNNERSDECSSPCPSMDDYCIQPEEKFRSLSPPNTLISTEEECVNKQILGDKENSRVTENFLVYQYKVKCCYCSEEVQKIELKKHKMQCQLKQSMCEFCGVSIQMRQLKTHILRVHEKTELCEKCGKFFSCHDFKMHKGECMREPTTFCEFCFHLLYSQLGYKLHMMEHRKGEGKNLGVNIKESSQKEMSSSYNCPVCGNNFPNELSVVVHLNAYKSVTCEPCNEVFKNERAFLVHVCMPGKNVWHCRSCFQTFKRKHSWQIHEQTHSVEDRTLNCKICGKKYLSLEILMQHTLNHKSNTYPCTFCDKKFNRPSLLKKHMLQHERFAYRCDTCRKLFQTVKSLRVHFVKTHLHTISQKIT